MKRVLEASEMFPLTCASAKSTGQLYFHFTDYGKKMGFLEKGNSVCVEIEKYMRDLSEYSFVVLTGKLRIVTEPQEKALVIERMVDSAKTKRLSQNFLMAHGFPIEKR